MEREEYIDKWWKWWNNLPKEDFKLVLENHVELREDGKKYQWWFGWSSQMTDRINSKLVKEIKNKSEISDWLWRFDDIWNYPFYCYTVVKTNSLKYSYNI